jgi:hypothetical protein
MTNIRDSLQYFGAPALLVALLALAGATASAQEVLFQLRPAATIEQTAKFFTVDRLRQIYLITPNNEIIKYGPDGKEQFRYNDNTLGDLAYIDATNPFNLLLFYADFQAAVTLDRTLNLIGRPNLWELNLSNPRAVAMANDNALWVYDDAAHRLLRVDQQGRTLSASDDLSLLLNIAPSPEILLARDNLVFANDPRHGILVFDNFSQYVRTLPVIGAGQLHWLEQRLAYMRDGALYLFDPRFFNETMFPLPPELAGARQLFLHQDRLHVLRAGGLDIYDIKP